MSNLENLQYRAALTGELRTCVVTDHERQDLQDGRRLEVETSNLQ